MGSSPMTFLKSMSAVNQTRIHARHRFDEPLGLVDDHGRRRLDLLGLKLDHLARAVDEQRHQTLAPPPPDDDPRVEGQLLPRQAEARAQIDHRHHLAAHLHDPRDVRGSAGHRRSAGERLHLQHLIGRQQILRAADFEDHVEDAHATDSSAGVDESEALKAGRSSTSVGCPSPRSVAPATPGTCTSGSSRGRTTTSC